MGTSDVASVEEIRTHFPALARREGDEPIAYFDGPGGTQVPRAVGDAMADYLYHHNANTHWAYPSSAETDAALDDARSTLGAFLNSAPDEIVFGANMTTLTFHLSRALGRGLKPKDEIVVTELDHHANVGPWVALAVERDVKVRRARFDPTSGVLDREHLAALIGPRTRLVAVGAASNALGTVTDVRAIADQAHAAGALVFVDGVHYAPHRLPDVRAFDCDFFACSAYKFYGPHVGVLFARRRVLSELPFAKLEPASDDPPERAETGTLNHEGIVGAAAAVSWLAGLGGGPDLRLMGLVGGQELRPALKQAYTTLHDRGAFLFAELWDGLASVPGVRLFGPPPGLERTPTIAFTVRDVPAFQVTLRLAKRGVFTSHGDFYAKTVVDRLGLQPEGLVRAGCACYTTADEVDRLVEGVRTIALAG
jgi:cysteine desulfurase family protein (TIGR01976 family)